MSSSSTLVSKLFKPRKALSQRVIEKCIGILRDRGCWLNGSGMRKVPLCLPWIMVVASNANRANFTELHAEGGKSLPLIMCCGCRSCHLYMFCEVKPYASTVNNQPITNIKLDFNCTSNTLHETHKRNL